jgi:hypothetical protein
MKKATPLVIIAAFVGAASILAFTLTDVFSGEQRFAANHSSSLSSDPNFKKTIAGSSLTYNPPHGKPGHRCDVPDGALLPKAAATEGLLFKDPVSNGNVSALSPALANLPATTSPEGATQSTSLNPAHGKPGHRCDVAVGAPLNSSTPSPVQAPTAAAKAPNLNPAHGQPGHKCDIAVGAPLTGAPSKKQSTPTNTVAKGALPTINPAHGQPFHRCDIAVGAPLNSSKKATASVANGVSSVSRTDSLNQPQSATSDSSTKNAE